MKSSEKISTNLDSKAITRVVTVGGLSRMELIHQLTEKGIQVNELGLRLLSSDLFIPSETRYSLVTVELSVRSLGYPEGARLSEIYKKASSLGLSLCPMELGPHLRLQFLDQPEGFWGHPNTQHRAPPGSITIASQPLTGDDDFPKGFYLRRIMGELWLRGYRSDSGHLWDPDDCFIFVRENEFNNEKQYI